MKHFQQTKHALGSTAVLTVVSENPQQAEPLLATLWRAIDEFEDRFSRFRESSELTKFNMQAGQLIAISPQFHQLLVRAQQLATDTKGLYNPFILPALQQAGYVASWPNTQAHTTLDYSERQVYTADHLELVENSARIPSSSALDFGGIGKGYLLDQLADIADGSCAGYWLSLGGDIICAGFDTDGQPWRLSVDAAESPGKSIAAVQNDTGRRLALTTSGTLKRAGSAHGSRWHHLIDPRTGRPADTDILTASVVSERADLADVLASCLVIAGSTEARNLAAAHHISALLQKTYGTAQSQTVITIGNQFILNAAGDRAS